MPVCPAVLVLCIHLATNIDCMSSRAQKICMAQQQARTRQEQKGGVVMCETDLTKGRYSLPSNMSRISGKRNGIGAVGESPPGHKRIQKHSCDTNGQLFGMQDSVQSSIHRNVLLHTPRVHRLHHLAKKSCRLQEGQEIRHNCTQQWRAHPIACTGSHLRC